MMQALLQTGPTGEAVDAMPRCRLSSPGMRARWLAGGVRA